MSPSESTASDAGALPTPEAHDLMSGGGVAVAPAPATRDPDAREGSPTATTGAAVLVAAASPLAGTTSAGAGVAVDPGRLRLEGD